MSEGKSESVDRLHRKVIEDCNLIQDHLEDVKQHMERGKIEKAKGMSDAVEEESKLLPLKVKDVLEALEE